MFEKREPIPVTPFVVKLYETTGAQLEEFGHSLSYSFSNSALRDQPHMRNQYQEGILDTTLHKKLDGMFGMRMLPWNHKRQLVRTHCEILATEPEEGILLPTLILQTIPFSSTEIPPEIFVYVPRADQQLTLAIDENILLYAQNTHR